MAEGSYQFNPNKFMAADMTCDLRKWANITQEAERIRQEAERIRQEAERSRQEAERSRQEAERNRQEAERNRQEADRQEAERIHQETELYRWTIALVVFGIVVIVMVLFVCRKSRRARKSFQVLKSNLTPSMWGEDKLADDRASVENYQLLASQEDH
ncbi:hypothetical protein BGZ97_009676 [Linnemannia gamsii]|uniref:Uncharacterized protein n=1 Tax=Linnemannia gamsii TaxID=64522 RepID=A0A9P6QNA9_9FUNG|nr:hypothetical protein BGZ97_009676 [Linnemannia gamsii]